ncbi:MAG: aldo/keto reductase [Candidatus Aminicenantes bacterium]|jgi:predicted aldo/keto reductase-like oxidoreductase
MRYKEFGKTGKRVSILGFGGMRFDPKDEERAVRTVHRAVELGINYFDTAPGYCEDNSERFIGKALDLLPLEKKKGIYVSTKSHYMSESTADDVRRKIDNQIKTLRLEVISFYNMWCIMDREQFKTIMEPGGPYEGALKAKEEGLIEHICGTAHASGEDIAEMVEADVFEGITLGYNIMNHMFRKKGLKAAAEAKLGVVTMNPLGGGMLTQDEQMLSVLKDDESDSFIAAALRFNFCNPEITVVLSGMKNETEVEANAKTAESVDKPDPAITQKLLERFESLGEAFCTTCGYCLEHCPEKIQIPLYASMWDRVRMKQPDDVRRVYKIYLAQENRWLKGKRASDCTQCGECEEHCTQKLPLREYMKKIAEFLGEE